MGRSRFADAVIRRTIGELTSPGRMYIVRLGDQSWSVTYRKGAAIHVASLGTANPPSTGEILWTHRSARAAGVAGQVLRAVAAQETREAKANG